MPQVQFRNVQAPDFSGTSDILRNASKSLNEGFKSANSLLASYQQGQSEKNDLLITQQLAGIKSIEEFDALIGDPTFGKGASADKLAEIGEFRQSFADLQGTRATTNKTAADILGVNARTADTEVQTANRVTGEANKVVLRDRATEDRATKEAKDAATVEFNGVFIDVLNLAKTGNLSPEDRARFIEGLNASGLFDPTESAGYLNQLDTAERQRKTDNQTATTRSRTNRDARTNDAAKARALQTAEIIAQAQNDAANTANVVTNLGFTENVLDNPALAGLTAVEQQQARASSPGAASLLSNVITNPLVNLDPIVSDAVSVIKQTEQDQFQNSTQAALIANVDGFSAGDPTSQIVDQLNISTDDGETRNLNSAKDFIRTQTSDIATELGVSRKVVAAATVATHDRNPRFLNTNKRRFPKDEIKAYIKENLDADKTKQFREQQVNSKSRIKALDLKVTKLNNLLQQIEKTPAGDPSIIPLQSQIQALRQDIVGTKNEDTSSNPNGSAAQQLEEALRPPNIPLF